MDQRNVARALAKDALEIDRPLDWFDELYVKAEAGDAAIPWADLVPNPNVVELLERRGVTGEGRTALKIGCGLGDDAEYLATLGFKVTAFDISPTAIRQAKDRFPDSEVEYIVADLFDPPSDWTGKFELVWESYTLQVLPLDLRLRAIEQIPDFLSEDGELVVVTRAREGGDPEGEMPWPLLESELRYFETEGLERLSFEDYTDNEDPPVRRFRALFRNRGQV